MCYNLIVPRGTERGVNTMSKGEGTFLILMTAFSICYIITAIIATIENWM